METELEFAIDGAYELIALPGAPTTDHEYVKEPGPALPVPSRVIAGAAGIPAELNVVPSKAGLVNCNARVEFEPAFATTPDPALATVRLCVADVALVPTPEVAVSVTT